MKKIQVDSLNIKVGMRDFYLDLQELEESLNAFVCSSRRSNYRRWSSTTMSTETAIIELHFYNYYIINHYLVYCIKLPDLNGIQIDYISDTDENLASFLSYCTPVCLQKLKVNYWRNNLTWVKSKFYVDAFSQAAARTFKLVYFKCIDFRVEDLQTIIRAAHNAEQIEFHFCWIHCSSDLDFGADLSYNTKILDFRGWGDIGCKERTTDWITDPLSFSLIVDAISNSGLKASLQKLKIACNQTLSASNVQAELDMKDMSHISVFEE